MQAISLVVPRKTALTRLGIMLFVVCCLGGCFLPSPHLYEGPERSDQEIAVVFAKKIKQQKIAEGTLTVNTHIAGLKNLDSGESLKIPRAGETVIAKVLPGTYEISINTTASVKILGKFQHSNVRRESLTTKLDKGKVYSIGHYVTKTKPLKGSDINPITRRTFLIEESEIVFATMGPVDNIVQYADELGYSWLKLD